MASNSWKLKCCVLLLLGSLVYTQNFIWNTVKIGGGGYVIGLQQGYDGTIYSRTDVGGMYRYNETNKYWMQLMDWLSIENKNLFGTDSIRVMWLSFLIFVVYNLCISWLCVY